jgi:hypothetical protein
MRLRGHPVMHETGCLAAWTRRRSAVEDNGDDGPDVRTDQSALGFCRMGGKWHVMRSCTRRLPRLRARDQVC